MSTPVPQLNSSEQTKFWQDMPNVYKGDVVGRKVLAWSKKFVGQRVLDLGAANGSLLRLIKSQCPQVKTVVGVDIAPKSPEVIKADCTRLPFSNGDFDTLFFTDVIEHLSDTDLTKCLAEMNRVLSNGGHAIVTTLNKEDLKNLEVQCPYCDHSFHRWGHFQVFDEPRVRQLFHDFGFEIVKLRTVHIGRWNRYGFLVPLLHSLGVHHFFRKGTWDYDLLFIAQKTHALSAQRGPHLKSLSISS